MPVYSLKGKQEKRQTEILSRDSNERLTGSLYTGKIGISSRFTNIASATTGPEEEDREGLTKLESENFHFQAELS